MCLFQVTENLKQDWYSVAKLCFVENQEDVGKNRLKQCAVSFFILSTSPYNLFHTPSLLYKSCYQLFGWKLVLIVPAFRFVFSCFLSFCSLILITNHVMSVPHVLNLFKKQFMNFRQSKQLLEAGFFVVAVSVLLQNLLGCCSAAVSRLHFTSPLVFFNSEPFVHEDKDRIRENQWKL